ncbi:hypothetical protein [Priestia taiwanensis]|uniref:Membrane protein n=1 Tax=Priestia taiwanensis TaxID=1347902 RepID=A0A917EM78_9BACI|nr:hypothetical protein [Priestia taiwanensis]MBM7361585.1 hypothetical protein [Priestia taiwanensis]GGE55324.1 membrane protein [Priestia taiwanensis]
MKKNEKEFEVLKIPILTERFHPMNIKGILLLMWLFCALFTYLEYFFLKDTRDRIAALHGLYDIDYYTTIIIAVPIVILFPKVMSMKFQRLQFILFIITEVKLGFQMFLLGHIGLATVLDKDIMHYIFMVTIILALVVLSISIMRFKFLLNQGSFKVRSTLYKKRLNNEINQKVLMPIYILIGAAGISRFLGEYANDITMGIVSTFFIFIIYLIFIILPEQIMTAYCKFIFPGFHVKEEI